MRSSAKKRKNRSSPPGRRVWLLAALLIAVGALIWIWHYGTRLYYREEAPLAATAEDVENSTAFLAITELEADAAAKPDRTVALDAQETPLVITAGETVRLQGATDLPVRIDAPEQTVRLILDGADISSQSGPGILVEDADRVIITLAEGSRNFVTDAPNRTDENDYDGCIYSECPLTFNGTGSLTVTGLYQDAIRSRDTVKIVSGDYRLDAKRTGIRGNDGIRIAGGTVFIGAENNGLQTTKRGAEGRGALVVSGGELSVVAGRYAFVVEKAQLYLVGCRVQLSSVAGDFDVHGARYIEAGCLV